MKMDLLEKAVEMRESQVLNVRAYRDLVIRRRFMAFCCVLSWIAVIILIAAIAIPKWEILKFTNIDWEIVQVELGVWGEWRSTSNTSRPITEWIPHFPAPPDHVARLAGADLKHFYRAQAALGVIGLCLLLATNMLALYTFYHHRYTYKRFACAMYVVIAMCIVTTIEVLSNSVDEWNVQVAQASRLGNWDYDAVKSSGYAKYLAYAVVGICLLTATAFGYASHKQKGDNAATADVEIEDRPVHIGR